jgi:predicted DCC family thiol-disulfide oxidoreductase YuxK
MCLRDVLIITVILRTLQMLLNCTKQQLFFFAVLPTTLRDVVYRMPALKLLDYAAICFTLMQNLSTVIITQQKQSV